MISGISRSDVTALPLKSRSIQQWRAPPPHSAHSANKSTESHESSVPTIGGTSLLDSGTTAQTTCDNHPPRKELFISYNARYLAFFILEGRVLPSPEDRARERLAPALIVAPIKYMRNLELSLSSIDFDGLTQLCSEVALSGQAIAR